MNISELQLERGVLREILAGLENERYFAEEFLPATPGPHRGTIKVVKGGAHFGMPQESGRRLPGQPVHRGTGVSIVDVDYKTQPYGWEEAVPREDIKRVDDYLNLLGLYGQICVNSVKTSRDLDLASSIVGASWAYTDTPGAGDKWNADGADPLAQIRTAIDALIGVRVNAALVGFDAWSAFSQAATVRSSMSIANDSAIADMDWFKKAFASKVGLDHIVVVGSASNSDGTGDSLSLSRIFAGRVFLGRIANVPGSTSGGNITFGNTALARVVEEELTLEEYYEPRARTRVVQAALSEANVVVDVSQGALLSSVVA